MQSSKPTARIRSQNKKAADRSFWRELWRTRREPAVMLSLISAVIVTIATAGQLVVSALQFKWTKKQAAADSVTAEARDKRLIGAAERLAAAASEANVLAYQSSASSAQLGHRALDEATRTARVDQRAWVVPKGFTVQWSPDGSAKFEWDIFNAGKTPAVAARSWWHLSKRPAGEGPPKWTPADRSQVGTVIGPGVWNHVIERVPPGTWGEEHRKANVVAYVQTLQCYRDVFGDEHWTKTCLVQRAELPFAYCTAANDAGDGELPECRLQ